MADGTVADHGLVIIPLFNFAQRRDRRSVQKSLDSKLNGAQTVFTVLGCGRNAGGQPQKE
jgi:hypothetical protein